MAVVQAASTPSRTRPGLTAKEDEDDATVGEHGRWAYTCLHKAAATEKFRYVDPKHIKVVHTHAAGELVWALQRAIVACPGSFMNGQLRIRTENGWSSVVSSRASGGAGIQLFQETADDKAETYQADYTAQVRHREAEAAAAAERRQVQVAAEAHRGDTRAQATRQKEETQEEERRQQEEQSARKERRRHEEEAQQTVSSSAEDKARYAKGWPMALAYNPDSRWKVMFATPNKADKGAFFHKDEISDSDSDTEWDFPEEGASGFG